MRLDSVICCTSALMGKRIKLIRYFVSVILIITMAACGKTSNNPPIEETNSAIKKISASDNNNQVLDIATDIVLTSQYYDAVEYRLSAKSVLVKPRSFGGLSILDINELYFYDSHIEVFPLDKVKNAPQSKQGLAENFSDLLEKYADSLAAIYGTVSRLHMEDVHITMVGAGREGSDIVITAEKLTKDFRNETSPKLYNVSFSEKGLSEKLLVSQVIWNLDDKNFVLK